MGVSGYFVTSNSFAPAELPSAHPSTLYLPRGQPEGPGLPSERFPQQVRQAPGVERSNLYRKLESYGIELERE
jgi:hypothetical protein